MSIVIINKKQNMFFVKYVKNSQKIFTTDN